MDDPESRKIPDIADATVISRPAAVVLDFEDENDSDNPLNWSLATKTRHIIVPALFSFVLTYTTTVYTPATADIMEEFNISLIVSLLGFSLYTLGLGFGPVIAAPISETYGRRMVYMLSLPLCALFTLGTGFANNYATICVCRFFAGIFGSPSLAIGAGTVSDLLHPSARGLALVVISVTPFISSSLGPLIGGFVTERKGWRWTMWTSLFFAVVTYTSAIGTKETYKKAILSARAKKKGLPLPPTPSLWVLFTVTFFRPVHMLLVEPIVLFVSLYVAFVFAVLYAFFAALPIVFTEVYDFDLGQNGLVFIASLIGTISGGIIHILCNRFIYRRIAVQYQKGGRGPVPPENHLYSMLIGSILTVIGLFWFAWTARPSVHWLSPVAAIVPFSCGNILLFIPSMVYLSEVYGAAYAASAIAAGNLMRYILGTSFPLFIPNMYQNLGVAWATSTFGFIAVALLPIPWILYLWGPAIRSRSSYLKPKN